jgi:hypothetical protein
MFLFALQVFFCKLKKKINAVEIFTNKRCKMQKKAYNSRVQNQRI